MDKKIRFELSEILYMLKKSQSVAPYVVMI